MTPLAHALANETLRPLIDRRIDDRRRIAPALLDHHFFDLTAVREMIRDLAARPEVLADDRLAFLPAPLTWLELNDAAEKRAAMCLKELPGGWAQVVIVCRGDDVGFVLEYLGDIRLRGCDEAPSGTARVNLETSLNLANGLAAGILAALALVNSPRIIGRRQHMPHAGLQRKIAASKGMVGKFPLQGWTEIVLEVTAPEVDGQVHETRLSGGKALHFCRAHLRIKNGRVEFVSSHWRGDPALGFKRSRYTVVPPRQGRAA